METEEKAIVCSRLCLGERMYSIPCRASCFVLEDLNYIQKELHQDDFKEKDVFILIFKIVLGKTASATRNLINSSPQTEETTFALSSVFILLLGPLKYKILKPQLTKNKRWKISSHCPFDLNINNKAKKVHPS